MKRKARYLILLYFFLVLLGWVLLDFFLNISEPELLNENTYTPIVLARNKKIYKVIYTICIFIIQNFIE